jgi:RNA polymerase sigma factor (sigma-70 family)
MNIDPQLIKDCIDGDRKSQSALHKLTYSYLMSICLRYTGNADRAKEHLNIGFFRILKYLQSYKQDQPFKPWIRRIMINTLIREYNKEKAANLNLVYVEAYHDNEDHSELNSFVGKIDAEQVVQLISQLPPMSRQVFNLFFVDGYKHREIAEMLNISDGTSKWHLNSAREKLKEMLRVRVSGKETFGKPQSLNING